ncbi:MAG: cation transporter [Micavibrio aeruginosavorus]|uniref:Cation transporter n=1 Tax=Micavibrio aeruginosavorus TaxID=349221 RepID=A0A7T5R352_9BACT|nr:MAG: cation transporter [Micavibrio aeruginosavorus]
MSVQEESFSSYMPHKALVAGMASIATVLLLILMKAAIFVITDAASILASLMDSLSDATVSVMTYFAIRFSLKPADDDHRSGHGKIEGLAALFQAALIMLAGAALLWESIRRLAVPQPIENHELAIVVMLVSIALSIVLIRIQEKVLKEAPSLAVEADQAHYATDIIVNAGVIVVMLLLLAGAPLWVDTLFAMAMVGYLGWTARGIGMLGLDMLLDRELPETIRQSIINKVRAHDRVIDMHDLRTSKSGMRVFISFDIEVDGDMKLTDAHEVARHVEYDLLRDFPHAEIMIHIDPYGDADDTRHNAR